MSIQLEITDSALKQVREALDKGKIPVLLVEDLGLRIIFAGPEKTRLSKEEERSLVTQFRKLIYPEREEELKVENYRDVSPEKLKEIFGLGGEYPFSFHSGKEVK